MYSQSTLQADKHTLDASAVLQNLVARDLCNPVLKKIVNWSGVFKDYKPDDRSLERRWSSGSCEVWHPVSGSSCLSVWKIFNKPCRLESPPGHRLNWVSLWFSSAPSSPMPTYCLQLHHDRSSPHFPQFIIHQSWNLTLFWLRFRQRLSISDK